jgi:catechol 2,3-dioxygenase-like lactoylglutathione lyase family enzyme
VIRGNNELALHVADPQSAASFYSDVLGCTLVGSDPDCVELVSGALRLFLLRDPAPTHEAVVPSFDVADRAAALVELQAAGCTLEPIGPHSPDGSYVRDPFGVLFDVVERMSSQSAPEPSTCGTGLAEHSEIPALFGKLIASLADNLDAHMPTVDTSTAAGRAERAAYDSLVTGFRKLVERTVALSAEMAGYRDLPMAPHNDEAFGTPQIASAFREYVALEEQVSLRLAHRHTRDQQLLARLANDT